MLGTVGTDPMGGAQRLTLGLLELSDGIPFVLLVMATRLAEAFRLALGESQAPQGAFSMRDLLIPMSLFRRLTRVAGRSSVLGRDRCHAGCRCYSGQFLCLRLREACGGRS